MAAWRRSALVPLWLLLSACLGLALAQGNKVCSAGRGRIEENEPAGLVVTTIVADADITVTIDQGPDSGAYSQAFEINGTYLVTREPLDYEKVTLIVLTLLCKRNSITVDTLTVIVEVLNVNDESPVFQSDFVAWKVPEDLPVGTSIGSLTATDADRDTIYYELVATTSDGSSYFRLAGVNSPIIQVNRTLDYDVFTHAQFLLYARDTSETNVTPSHTATATINITISDVDNKNPWFQPCRFIDANKKICHSDGYQVNVTRLEQATGALVLMPGPLYAIDGDRGINSAIRYEIISGNEENIFVLDHETGNITMQRPATVLGTKVLEVMASEVLNSLRYAVTSVKIQVVEKNNHPPKFPSTDYRGTMPAYSLPGSLVMDYSSPSRPLKIFAADDDFNDKKNPAITYSIENSTDFLVSQDGFIQSNVQLNTSGTNVILVAAVDRTSGEKTTTLVSVEVTPVAGAETTTIALTTVTSTPSEGTSTQLPPVLTSSALLPGTVTRTTVKTLETTTRSSHTGSSTTGITNRPSGTLLQTTTVSTTSASGTPGKPSTGSVTSKPSTATTGPTTSTTTKYVTTPAGESPGSGTMKPTIPGSPVVISSLQYSAADMAAVGATLAAVLLICLAFLGFLIHKQYGYKFEKISVLDNNFLSTGSGDSNDGNKMLIENEYADSTNSASNEADDAGGTLNLNFNTSETTTDSLSRGSTALMSTEATFPASFIAVDQLEGDLDNDKEVKSILTKERRVNDESYKAVWFKGDIEPDEVVTIHETEQEGEGEGDEEEEEEVEEEDESDDGEDQQGGGYNQAPTVAFSINNESTNTIL
ncbi:cadherin-related family member 5 isoform X3 [Lissotriton helveticus]